MTRFFSIIKIASQVFKLLLVFKYSGYNLLEDTRIIEILWVLDHELLERKMRVVNFLELSIGIGCQTINP